MLIAADSLEVDPSGVTRPCSKILGIPHAQTVVTGSGLSSFFFAMYTRCFAAQMDFDGMVSKLPMWLPDCYEELSAARRILPFSVESESQGFIIAGWSQGLGRMAAVCYDQVSADKGFDVYDVPPGGSYLNPGYDEVDLPNPNCVESMAGYVREQVRIAREVYGKVAGGGNIIIATIEPGRIAIETVSAL